MTSTEVRALATIPGRARGDRDIEACNLWLIRRNGTHYGTWPRLRVVHSGDLYETRTGVHSKFDSESNLVRVETGAKRIYKYENLPIESCWMIEALPNDLSRLGRGPAIALETSLHFMYEFVRGASENGDFSKSPKPCLSYVRWLFEGPPVEDPRAKFQYEKRRRQMAEIDECLIGNGIAGRLYDREGVSFSGLEIPKCRTSRS